MNDFLDDYILFDLFYSSSDGASYCPACEIGMLEQIDDQTRYCDCCNTVYNDPDCTIDSTCIASSTTTRGIG